MKNDVSHHGILLNLIFAQFCRIFPGKTGFWIRKTGYPIQKFIFVKTYLGQGEYVYMYISAKLVKKHPKIRVFSDFRKNIFNIASLPFCEGSYTLHRRCEDNDLP